MYSINQDVIWGHGKDGGYLVLGNIVYTVDFCLNLWLRGDIKFFISFLVCGGNGLPQGRSDNKFLDMADSCVDLGLDRAVVRLHVRL